jgi:hypothetical protein
VRVAGLAGEDRAVWHHHMQAAIEPLGISQARALRAPIAWAARCSQALRLSSPFRRIYTAALPRRSVPLRHLPATGQISLTDLCDPPYLQGLVKQNGRAFALDGTDDLSVAGPERLRGDTPGEQVRWLRHSATVSNLQSGACGACGRRADGWLVFRERRRRPALHTATWSRAAYSPGSRQTSMLADQSLLPHRQTASVEAEYHL